jgi:hypothetical protein
MKRSRFFVASCFLLVSASISLRGQASSPRDCGDTFAGFDGRLAVELVTVLPADVAPLVGLEVTPNGPVIATSTKLYAVTKDGIVALPLDQEIRGISVDAEGRLALQSREGVSFVRRTSLEPVAAWKQKLEGSVTNSGATAFLEMVSANGQTTFGARMATHDRVLPIVRLDGELRAAAWDAQGLVAVVGNALYRWVQSANVLERLSVDSGLQNATGVCSLGPKRVLVALRNATLLFSGKSMTVVAAVGGTCRVSGQDVLLLDPTLKRLWKVGQMDALGEPERDRAHATRLLQLAVAQEVKFTRTREFSEAVRLVGCTAAHQIAAELQR